MDDETMRELQPVEFDGNGIIKQYEASWDHYVDRGLSCLEQYLGFMAEGQ